MRRRYTGIPWFIGDLTGFMRFTPGFVPTRVDIPVRFVSGTGPRSRGSEQKVQKVQKAGITTFDQRKRALHIQESLVQRCFL